MDPLFLAFQGIVEEKWQQQKILLAVSGGVDSMVLLHLMEQLHQLKPALTFGVAHINHQLREASKVEVAYIEAYCQKRGIAFHLATWEQPATTGMEAAARAFRYQFFETTMKQEGYQVLMTAHHQEDQAETVLMKMIRGGHLKTKTGIAFQREFAGGTLFRPLLASSKTDILRFAKEQRIDYFEDSSNQTLAYQRNRLRLQVLPLLQQENDQASHHMAQFAEDLTLAQELIDQQMSDLFQRVVTVGEAYQLDLPKIRQLSAAESHFFWQYFFQQVYEKQGIHGKNRQLADIQQMLKKEKAQWTLDFEDGWQLQKEYQQLTFRRGPAPAEALEMPVLLQGSFINEQAWVAIYPADQPPTIPAEVADWQEFRRTFHSKPTRFYLRKRQAGDRIQLTEELSKKVRRYFIDQKIPASKREASWIVCDDEEKVIALLPFVISYLSIAKETDTILYTLVYKYR